MLLPSTNSPKRYTISTTMEQLPDGGDNLEILVNTYDDQRFRLVGIQAGYQEQLRLNGFLDRIIGSMHPFDRTAFWSHRFTEAWVSCRTKQTADSEHRLVGVLFRKPSVLPGNPPRERFIGVVRLDENDSVTYTRGNIPVVVATSILGMAQYLQSLANTDILPNLSADFLSIVEPPDAELP